MRFIVSRITKDSLNPEDPPCIDALFDQSKGFWIKDVPDLKELMRFFSRYGELVIKQDEKTQMPEIIIYDDWEDIIKKLKR